MIKIKRYNGRLISDMSRDELVAALTDACQKNHLLQQRNDEHVAATRRDHRPTSQDHASSIIDRIFDSKPGRGRWW